MRDKCADGVLGHLDAATPNEVTGWAAPQASGDRQRAALRVELFVNGVHAISTTADEYRDDLKRLGLHPTGRAGYRFRIPWHATLQPGDRVQVFAGEARAELGNSPFTMPASPVPSAEVAAVANRKPLVFLHIPKTAGTSLRVILSGQLAAPRLVTLDPPLPPDHKAMIAQRLPQMRLLMGHLFFGVDEWLGFRADYATFLREPVARVVSFWKHQQTHPHSAFHDEVKAGMTLRELVAGARTLETNNHMTRILVGAAAPGMLDGTMNLVDDERYLRIALKHVRRRFRFVGFVEHFDDSVRGLFQAMGWPPPARTTERRNVLHSRPDTFDEATLQTIRDRNALDLALYRELLASSPWARRV